VLSELLDKKGSLSRQIGEAKRSGQAFEDLLDEMKQVSKQIKAIQSKEKVSRKPDSRVATEANNKPALFDLDDSQQDASCSNVVVKLVEGGHIASLWDQYVSSKPNASIYHFWAFKVVVTEAFGHNAVYLAAFDAEGSICGILPAVELDSRLFGHFMVSLPFFTYGAALADNTKIERCLYTALFEQATQRKAEHVELRCVTAWPETQNDCSEKLSKVSMIRALPDSAETLWADLGTKVRAQIKKAQRYSLRIKFGKSELLDDFYHVFSVNMRDLGTPVYSKQFFARLIESELKEKMHIGIVYCDAKPVACCFLMGHQKMMEIPWASALQSANHMNVNMYMYWEVLKKTLQEGHRFFDFGRSSVDGSTYRFKKQWGAQAHQLYWYYWLPEDTVMPELNPNNPKYQLLISVWKKLPVWFTQLIGPPIVKYLP